MRLSPQAYSRCACAARIPAVATRLTFSKIIPTFALVLAFQFGVRFGDKMGLQTETKYFRPF